MIKTPPAVVSVLLKDGTTYNGMYRIKVDHLPLNAVVYLGFVVVFAGAFVPLLLWNLDGGPQWPALATGYFAASFLFGLVRDAFRLLRQAGS